MALTPSARFGVYVHIPFCASKCEYCAFATWTDRGHLVDAYIEACVLDVERRAGELERLAEIDPNPFARYEALQELMLHALLAGAGGERADPLPVIAARSPPSFATCVVSPRSPRPPIRRR